MRVTLALPVSPKGSNANSMNSQVLQIVQAICKEAMHLPGEVGLAVMWRFRAAMTTMHKQII